MPTVYLIAGCNGAGKTTASFSLLPEILDCQEYVNADNIAVGISPFQHFMPHCEYWSIYDNSTKDIVMVAEGIKDMEIEILNNEIWQNINRAHHD